jgi:FOG: TPR repeat, SEL1 subfamily
VNSPLRSLAQFVATLLAKSLPTSLPATFLTRTIWPAFAASAWWFTAAVTAFSTAFAVTANAEPQVACSPGYPLPTPTHLPRKTTEASHRVPLAHMDDARCAAAPSASLDRLAAYHCAQLYDAAGRQEDALGWYGVAAVAGYGPAQKRLGNLYGGEGDVARDYACAVYWQRRARESGESIDLPHVFMGGTPP